MNKADFLLKKKCYFSLFSMLLLSLNGMTYSQGSQDIVIGRNAKMSSDILGKEIQLSIHIPNTYDQSEERYPVLYTFQTHFEQVSAAVKNLYDYQLIPKLIVVRVDNYEFGYLSPTKIESNSNSGRADEFLKFFESELFQYIDSNFRTHQFRIVFSNSWGAIFAVYSILAKPSIFNAAVASIPWIKYDDENRYLINHTESFLIQNKYQNFLYMTMDNESVILADLDIFINILKKNPREGLEWEYHYWPEEDHSSTPYRSIYSGLRSLFKGWNEIPPDIAYRGIEEIKKHELFLNKKFGYDIGISSSALKVAGQELQSGKKYPEAISIFKYMLEKRPDDAFGYITLGRAYEENGQLLLAREAYEQGYQTAVVTAHPQVEWVRNFVVRITQKINDLGR